MRKSFEEICGPYAGLVYRHCLQMLGNAHDAEDAAQETMLRAFRSFDRFDGRTPGGWLYRVAHNTCLDRLRAAKGKEGPALEELREKGFDPQDPGPDPEEQYLRSARREALQEAISALPLQDQALLAMFYSEGLRYEEIAAAEGMKLGTVKSRLNRAKEALRKKLDFSD